MDKRPVEFVEILATFNNGDLAFIKSLLEARGICYYIEGENFCLVRPLVAPARVKVDRLQLDEAKELLRDFRSGTFGYQIENEET